MVLAVVLVLELHKVVLQHLDKEITVVLVPQTPFTDLVEVEVLEVLESMVIILHTFMVEVLEVLVFRIQ